MALGFKNFLRGIGLIPNATTQTLEKGDMDYVSSDNKLRIHNGTTPELVVTETSDAILQNKKIDDASVNTITFTDNLITPSKTVSLSTNPDTGGASYDFYFPNNPPEPGSYLTFSGPNTYDFAWTKIPIFPKKVIILTGGSNQYTPSPGTNSIVVHMVAGGGGGGSGSGIAICRGGGGGGAGGYTKLVYYSIPFVSAAYTIGTGGSGGIAGGSGGNGTSTTFYDKSCQGGLGGKGASSGAGGRGGFGIISLVSSIPSMPNLGTYANSGGSGSTGSLGSSQAQACGGVGGGSQFGGGAVSNDAGLNGLFSDAWGGGGSGGGGPSTATTTTGGVGIGGVIIIEEYE